MKESVRRILNNPVKNKQSIICYAYLMPVKCFTHNSITEPVKYRREYFTLNKAPFMACKLFSFSSFFPFLFVSFSRDHLHLRSENGQKHTLNGITPFNVTPEHTRCKLNFIFSTPDEQETANQPLAPSDYPFKRKS
jgi:hypothetical protein